MTAKKLGANEKCGCGSGLKHKRCCMRKGSPWFVDERGRVIDERLARLSQRLREMLSDIFEKRHGRPMKTYLDSDEAYGTLTHREKVDYLLGLDLPPDVVYAYDQTGVFVPYRWLQFFRLTFVVPRASNQEMSPLAPALEALADYWRNAGMDVPEVEYLTVEEVLADASKHEVDPDKPGKHEKTMDKSGSRHMMQPTRCRGCRFTRGLLYVLTEISDRGSDAQSVTEDLLGGWDRELSLTGAKNDDGDGS